MNSHSLQFEPSNFFVHSFRDLVNTRSQLAFVLHEVEFYNPAFDVTPARLIQAIITELGAFAPGDLGQLQSKS